MYLFIIFWFQVIGFYGNPAQDYSLTGTYDTINEHGPVLTLKEDRTFEKEVTGPWHRREVFAPKTSKWTVVGDDLKLEWGWHLFSKGKSEIYRIKLIDEKIYLVPFQHLKEFEELISAEPKDEHEEWIKKMETESHLHKELN